MARNSKSRSTGTDFSTIGAGSRPGTITGCPAFRNVPWKSPFALRIASPSSDEVRKEVWPRYRWATTWTLSPRLATYSALPGGATVVSDGSGAADTNGVEDRDVFTSLGRKVCAAATV